MRKRRIKKKMAKMKISKAASSSLMGKGGLMAKKQQKKSLMAKMSMFGFGKPQETELTETQLRKKRSTRFSNVNLQILNTHTSESRGGGQEIDKTFQKQTVLEYTITFLTIKRTMTCFFLTVFSVAFWIPTTYKPYMSELEPIAGTMQALRATNVTAYQAMVAEFIEFHKDKYDYLVGLEAPNFPTWEADQSDIRAIEMLSATHHEMKFTYSFERTVKIYAGVMILAFISILILLTVFILLINNDVAKFVVAPLEKMFEKVT